MGMYAPRSLAPGSGARRLADHMANQAQVHQEILQETVDSARSGTIKESGRTVCGAGGSILGPSARFPRSVKLQECPADVDGVGVWHTHVTRSQFLDPEHSLPDVANVLFHDVDASIVVGLDTMHVLTTPDDPEAGAEAFRDAIGLNVDSTSGVEHAIRTGLVDDPTRTRQRVFRDLSALFERRSTPLNDPRPIRELLHTVPTPLSASGHGEMAYELIECAVAEAQIQMGQGDPIDRLAQDAREGWDGIRMGTWRFAQRASGEAMGIVAGTVLSRLLGLS